MPDVLTDSLHGIPLWRYGLGLIGALVMGYLLTKYGGRDE